MNRIDEEEDFNETTEVKITVDRSPCVQLSPECSNNNIYSSKRTSNTTDRSKYQTTNRPTSLPPARHNASLNEKFDEDVKQRRRYASDSSTNNKKSDSALLVTSFLQHLRNELRTSTNDKLNDFYRDKSQQSLKNSILSSIKMSQSIIMNKKSENENVHDANDHDEIFTLINLLVLRVECLTKEKRPKNLKTKCSDHPTVSEVDQSLIEYLYYLFKKFSNDDTNLTNDSRTPVISKNNFVNVCQTLVRNGCFDMSSTDLSLSPNQSLSDSTSSNDLTLASQTFVHEYRPDAANETTVEKSSTDNGISSTVSSEKETWLVVDFKPNPSEETLANREAVSPLLALPTDEQLLTANDIYKSCESGSSYSLYLSPNSSSFDLANMVQEFDETNHHSSLLMTEDASSSNVITESKTRISDDLLNGDIQYSSITSDTICTRLTNDVSSIQNDEQMKTNDTDRMSRREKKMQERWSASTKTDKNNNEEIRSKPLLGIHFPPIAVLRRKFSSPSSPAASTNKEQKIETETTSIEKSDISKLAEIEEINTSLTTAAMEQTNPNQTVETSSKDTLPLMDVNVNKNNDDEQLPTTAADFICLSEKENSMGEIPDTSSSNSKCQTETRTNIHNGLVNNQQTSSSPSNSQVIINSMNSSLASSFSSSPQISISSSCLTSTAHENETEEYLPKEKEEKEKEEQQHCDDDYNDEEEKKNNSSFVHDYHASGIILRNDELRQTGLLQQEKKEKEEKEKRERPSSPLPPTLEQFDKQRIEDESPIQTLSNNLNQMAMDNADQNEEQYKKIEIEEIPDDEEVILKQNSDLIEPVDYILTDDERKQAKQSSIPSNTTQINDEPIKFDSVFACYEKAMAKLADTHDETTAMSNTLSTELPSLSSSITTTTTTTASNQQSADDPIALRALKRFEERMNAAAAAVKTNKDETNSKPSNNKSSWSGSLSASRKSLENLFKNIDQQLSSTPNTILDESTTAMTSSTKDTYIRPRKTFDDNAFNYGMTLDLFSTKNPTIDKTDHDDDQKIDEQQQSSSTIVENDDKRVVDNELTNNIDSNSELIDQKQVENVTTMPCESTIDNEKVESTKLEPSKSIDEPIIDNTSNIVMPTPESTDELVIRPYGFQIEGRRRLTALERMRERRQSHDSIDKVDQEQQPQPQQDQQPQPQQQQQQEQQEQQPQPQPQQRKLQDEYVLKPEEVQDPIVRRALERFDEKSRKLTETKSMNYDEIQDPITRRALMRLESNLKRTIPPTTTYNDANENYYTENYTLGSLQPTNDRLAHYNSSSQPPILNNRTKHISVHQRYCTPSANDISDPSTMNNMNFTQEDDIPIMRVPSQSVYVASSNQQQQQQQQQPISYRQRSRSEDMLNSRELMIGQTTNLDDIDTSSQLQRNRSSNEVALNDTNFHLPNALIKSLEPNFVRTTESSTSYTTPTQTYSAYSCEYTRPCRNPLLTKTTSEASNALQDEPDQSSPSSYTQQEQAEIQRPIPYRPNIENQYEAQPPSAFAPVRSSAAPTNNYYTQQPLPTSSYNLYTNNNLNQTPYSDDPIVRRALERFNTQMQNSLLSTSLYQPNNGYMSRSGTFQDSLMNSNHPGMMTTSTYGSGSSNGVGYQSIIGRRRQSRYDDTQNYFDNTSVGDAYASSVFANAPNLYAMGNSYMNVPEPPPMVPPRLRRMNYQTDEINDQYRRHSVDDYLSENINNNNNNHAHIQPLPRESYIHYAHPATISNATTFRPINADYNQQYDLSNQYLQEQEDLRQRTQSTSSTNSSDSLRQQQRLTRPNNVRTTVNNQQRLPPPSVSVRTNPPQNERKSYGHEKSVPNKSSPVNAQASLPGHNLPNNGGNDSVFHRLAYTGTKASLSKSSSNSCSNLLNKNSPHMPINQLKSCEIDLDDTLNSPTTAAMIESNNEMMNEQNSALENKYQRSKSVDGRARLKIIQARANQNNVQMMDVDDNTLMNDENERSIPSSKFTPINGRREVPTTCVPLTPMNMPRTTAAKLPPTSKSNLSYSRSANGIRAHGSNGNLIDSQNQQQNMDDDENSSFNVDGRLRTALPVQHYSGNNHIQTSLSTSAINTAMARSKPPVSIPISIDKRDSNTTNSDLNRASRRTDDHRLVSPSGQRRNIPVSVFVPAKHDNKRPAPAPPVSNSESQNQTSNPSRAFVQDNNFNSATNDLQMNKKLSSANSGSKTPTNVFGNELALTTDKHETNKKMNVFERLFRGNKKPK